MRGVRGFLVVLAVQAVQGLRGQDADRLIILADRDPANVVVRQEQSRLVTDAGTYFGIRPDHIHLIAVDPSPGPRPDMGTIPDIDAGLAEAEAYCLRPEETVWIAFVFSTDKGPDPNRVMQFLRKAKARMKVVSTGYAFMHLAELSGSRYPLLAYARGETGHRDTVEKHEGKFPLIPVIVGGAALTAGGIVLLTGKGEDGCTVVDPAWILPTPPCSDDAPVQLEISGTPGGTWSGIGVSSGGIFNPAAGTQAVTYTVGEGTCRQSLTQTIQVIQPNADWTIPGQPCEGETITLVPEIPGGTWSGPGILQQPDGTALFSQPGAGQFAVTYTVVLNGCSAASTQSITVIPDADASWTSPGQVCSGETLTLTPGGTPGGQWSGEGITNIGDGTATFMASTPGSFSVTYTAGTGECMASLTQTIDVLRTPDPGWSLPGPVCASDQTTLTPSGDPGGTWSGDGVTDLGNGTATFVQSAAGSYAVTYTIASGSCTGTLTQPIEVLEVGDPSWNSPGPICSGSSTTLVPTGTPGGIWSGEGVTDLGDGTALFAPSAAGSIAVTYTAGTAPCSRSLTLDIEVLETPEAAWAPPPGICTGSTVTLVPSGTPGGMWSGPGVMDAGDGTATFMQNEPGNYAVTYIVLNGICGDTLTREVEVLPLPDPTWSPPDAVCTGRTTTLTPSGTPGGTWSGAGITDLGDGTALFTPETAGAIPVTYTVGVEPCIGSLTLDIQVVESPLAAWEPPSDVCAGSTISLSPSGTPGGTWSGSGVTDAGDGTATFSQGEPGTYAVTYSVINGQCGDTLTRSIVVLPTADPAWTPPDDVCAGQQVTLTPSGTPGGIWSGTGVTDLGDGTALFSGGEAGKVTITYAVALGPCTDSLAQDITVFPAADATWMPPAVICSGEIVTLTPAGTPGGTWTGEGITDLGDGTAQFQLAEAGVVQVTYAVQLGPCQDTSTQQLQVIALADPSWSPPTDVCINENVILVPTGTPGGTWSGPGVVDQGDGTASFVQAEAGTYTVTYTAGQGACQQSSTQDIVVISPGDPSWVPPQQPVCPEETVTLSAPAGNWSGPGVTNLGNGSGEFVSAEPGTFSVTLTVGSGDCTASQSHDIVVGDDEAPVIDFPAEDETANCDGEGNPDDLADWLDAHGGADAFDNCDGPLTWTHDFQGFPYDCGTAGSVDVVFTVTDPAGNEATTMATFTIVDDDPPFFDDVPGDIVVPCDNIPAPPTLTAFDDCSGPATVTFDEAPPGPGCPYVIVRSWIATDDCGNTAYAEQVITAVDDIAPEIIFAPPPMNIECPGPPESCIPPIEDAVFSDNCDPDPVIDFDEMIIPLPPAGINIIRCWFATDACGNVSETYCQSIFIFTLTPPEAPAMAPDNLQLSVGAMSLGDGNPRFSPGQARWIDAGPLNSLDLIPLRQPGRPHTWPVLGIAWEQPLGPKTSVMFGAYRARFEERQTYASAQGPMTFRGRMNVQGYDLTLRLRPEPAGRLFYTIGPRYLRFNMDEIALDHAGGTLHAASGLQDAEWFVGGGAGGEWPIGRLGRLEVMLEYGTNRSVSLRTAVKLTATNPLTALSPLTP